MPTQLQDDPQLKELGDIQGKRSDVILKAKDCSR